MTLYKTINSTPVYISNPRPTGDADQTLKVRNIPADTIIEITKESFIRTSWSNIPILILKSQTPEGAQTKVAIINEFVYKSAVTPISDVEQKPQVPSTTAQNEIKNTQKNTSSAERKNLFTPTNIFIGVLAFVAILGLLKWRKVI